MFLCALTHRCQEEFQLRSSQTYMRSQVLEAERGICQHCGLHAHDLFIKVRDAPPSQRKEILENTWLTQLPLKQVGHRAEEALFRICLSSMFQENSTNELKKHYFFSSAKQPLTMVVSQCNEVSCVNVKFNSTPLFLSFLCHISFL